MKIEGWQVKREAVSIEVDFWDMFEKVKGEAFHALGIRYSDAYLDKAGKRIMYEEEARHGSNWEEVLIDKPTAEQIAVIRHFDQLRNLLRGVKPSPHGVPFG